MKRWRRLASSASLTLEKFALQRACPGRSIFPAGIRCNFMEVCRGKREAGTEMQLASVDPVTGASLRPCVKGDVGANVGACNRVTA